MKKGLAALLLCLVLVFPAKAQVIFAENFESTTGMNLPPGWTQSVNTYGPDDLAGWCTGTNLTRGTVNFRMSPHTRFVSVVDDKGPGSDNTNTFMVMPPVNLSGTTNPFLSFDCCYLQMSYGGYTELATVEVSTDSGRIWHVVEMLGSTAPGWWRNRTIDLSAFAGDTEVYIGFRYSDNAGWAYGIGIDDIKIFVPPLRDMAIAAVAPATGSYQNYGLTGSAIPLQVSVTNNGSLTATEFTVSYRFNSGAVVTTTIAPVAIAPFTTQWFALPNPVLLPGTAGAYDLAIWINQAGDTIATNDTAASTLIAVPFIPNKKPLIEEATGGWCGWCVRGKVYMDSLQLLYGKGVSLAAVHNTDPMANTLYDNWFSVRIGDYPNVWIDRRIMDDPKDLTAAGIASATGFGFANINANATLAEDGTLAIYTEVMPAIALGKTALAFIITEDSVRGFTDDWNQVNNYSYRSRNIPFEGGGVDYNAATNPIVGALMQYNHVARAIVPTPKGNMALLPGTMLVGETYNATQVTTLDAAWNKSKLHVIAVLIDSTTGHVLNTQNFDVQPIAAGITAINSNAGSNAFVLYPNPASNNVTLSSEAIQYAGASVTVYDMLGRIVWQASIAGNTLQLPVADWPGGLYTVRLQSTAGVATQLLSVVR